MCTCVCVYICTMYHNMYVKQKDMGHGMDVIKSLSYFILSHRPV